MRCASSGGGDMRCSFPRGGGYDVCVPGGGDMRCSSPKGGGHEMIIPWGWGI